MYDVHIVSDWNITNLDRIGMMEYYDSRLWSGASEGDFVLFTGVQNRQNYLTRVVDVNPNIEDTELRRILLESPVYAPVNGERELEIVANGYVHDRGENGEGYQSVRDITEKYSINLEEISPLPSWLSSEEEYHPSITLSPMDEPNQNSENLHEGNGGGGEGGEGGGGGEGGSDGNGGIDRTGTILSEQYSARDAIRQAAKDTTQMTILLFGVVLAGLSLFEDAIRNVDLLRNLLPIGFGILLLLGALLGSAYVLIRTAAFPRPSIDTISKKHKTHNENILVNKNTEQVEGEAVEALKCLSKTYFEELEIIRKRNTLLGRLIGLTVGFSTIGTIMVFYGALVLGLEIRLTAFLLTNWWIIADTLIILTILLVSVGMVTKFALKETDLRVVALVSNASNDMKL